MNCQRRGTDKKIKGQLKRHAELMAQYRAQGLSQAEASAKAYLEVMKGSK